MRKSVVLAGLAIGATLMWAPSANAFCVDCRQGCSVDVSGSCTNSGLDQLICDILHFSDGGHVAATGDC
jgi:hypothetical protein